MKRHDRERRSRTPKVEGLESRNLLSAGFAPHGVAEIHGIKFTIPPIKIPPISGTIHGTVTNIAQTSTTTEVVNIMLGRFLSVPLAEKSRLALVDFLNNELGTSDVQQATTYMEDPLRLLVHLIMSTPEYQLA